LVARKAVLTGGGVRRDISAAAGGAAQNRIGSAEALRFGMKVKLSQTGASIVISCPEQKNHVQP